jgi:hypothetical protein
MNTIKMLCAALTCTFLIIGNTSAQTSRLTVLDMSGKTVVLNLDGRCLVFGVATWCPHSLELKKLINYSSISSDLHRGRIIFLFENDEWPIVEAQLKQLVDANEMTSDDAEDKLAELKERAHGSSFFDPDVIRDAGCECYQLPANSTVKIPGFPTQYSPEKGTFVDFRPKVFLKFTSTDNLVAAIDAIYPNH